MDWSTVSSSGVSMGYLSLCAKANTATSIPTMLHLARLFFPNSLKLWNPEMFFGDETLSPNNIAQHLLNLMPSCPSFWDKLTSDQNIKASRTATVFPGMVKFPRTRMWQRLWCQHGALRFGKVRKGCFRSRWQFRFFSPRDHGEAPCRKTMDSVVQECP